MEIIWKKQLPLCVILSLLLKYVRQVPLVNRNITEETKMKKENEDFWHQMSKSVAFGEGVPWEGSGLL